MSRLVRLEQNRWWRRFWLCYFTGAGVLDLVFRQWAWTWAMAGMMAANVVLWMAIDRRTS